MGRGSGGRNWTLGAPGNRPSPGRKRENFGDFKASELYCPRCRMAVRVREKLLLVLPDGEIYEYLCSRCGASVGEKTARGKENIRLVVTS